MLYINIYKSNFNCYKSKSPSIKSYHIPGSYNSWADPEGGTGDPEKSQKYRVSLQYWSRSPEKSQSYQASNQWAIIGPPAYRWPGQWWPIYSGIWILYPLIKIELPLKKLSRSTHATAEAKEKQGLCLILHAVAGLWQCCLQTPKYRFFDHSGKVCHNSRIESQLRCM